MKNPMLDFLIFGILIVFGAYQLYKGIKQYFDHQKAKQTCLETHKGNFEFFEEFKLWLVLYLVLTVVSIIGGIYSWAIKGDYAYGITFLVLSTFMFGFALDTLVKRRAWFYEDGFFYEKKFYRYKSVAAVRAKKSLAKGYDVTFLKDPAMVITKKMGTLLQEKIQENRKKKSRR